MIANNKKQISYFDLLQVNEDASLDEIKNSYKKLVQIYHPDKYKTSEKKQEAEKKFKIIKKAYDEIIKIYNTQENNNQDFDSIYSNPEFISFFVNQNINVENLKSKEYSKRYANKAINFMKEKIDFLNLDYRYVYNCIAKSKLFIKWKVDDHSELEKIIQKELIYRNYIRSQPIYQCFKQNKRRFYKPDVDLTIKIRPSIAQHQFSQFIHYQIKTICSICNGIGCKFCHKGIIEKKVSKKITFSNIENNSVYKITNEGSKYQIINGDLNIKFVYQNNLKQPYLVSTKNNNFLSQFKNYFFNNFDQLILFIKKHKIHFIYLSSILLIIIIAILLIVLI